MTFPQFVAADPELTPYARFGHLTLIEKAGHSSWRVRCDCGAEHVCRGNDLKRGHTRSCGCLGGSKTHGKVGSPEYQAWVNMRARCENPKVGNFKDYGGRGICVCKRWQKFENFYADMGDRPSTKHSIDRYPDNNGNYEPGNVRWATWKEQAKNKRPTSLVGEKHPRARLTSAQVREIRASDLPNYVFAERYHVAPSTISCARSGHSWRCL
jgi:hypothetical protein